MRMVEGCGSYYSASMVEGRNYSSSSVLEEYSWKSSYRVRIVQIGKKLLECELVDS
jgi:hypothetical protein